MNKKLTLTIDKDIIEKAKKYAQEEKRSLSSLVENYLKSLVKVRKVQKNEMSPELKALAGGFKLPDKFEYQKELTKSLSEKYMK